VLQNLSPQVRPKSVKAEKLLDASDVAEVMRFTRRSALSALARWFKLGVEGIYLVPSRGRYGKRYVCDPSLMERWLDCSLPDPHT
jgi:hypothetical protein